MQRQVGGRIADLMLRVFGVVAPKERPRALPEIAVDVLDPRRPVFIAQYDVARLKVIPHERRGETVEVGDHLAVVLGQHRGNGIDLGTEVEERERAERLPARGSVDLVAVDIGEARDLGVRLHVRAGERERPAPVELGVGVGIDRRAVGEAGGDVRALRGERQLDRLGRRAHREQKAPVRDVLADGPRYAFLEVGHVMEPEPACGVRVESHHLGEPRLTGVEEIEFRILAGEVLVVQVQPVVACERAPEDLGVPYPLEGNPGVLQGHRHGVVPGGGVGRDVDGDFGRLFERHAVRVRRSDLPADRRDVARADRVGADARQGGVAADRLAVRHEEGAAAVIEEPLHPNTGLDGAVGDPVGLEMVALRVVHGNQELGGQAVRR